MLNVQAVREPKTTSRKRHRHFGARYTWQLSLLALPGIIYYIIWHYIPMGGLVLAFKDFRYDKGIFGSPWSGFTNFKFFFATDMWKTITGNTLMYAVLFLITTTFFCVLIAMLLSELASKRATKAYQTSMFLPNFMSWVMVSFIVYLFLNKNAGILNQIGRAMGGKNIGWYQNAKYWPFILVIVNLWKNIGMNALMYYAALMGIDQELFEAAEIDGANKFQQSIHISLPHLVPLITILSILAIGGFFRGDFGLFYNVPRNAGVLYSATDIIDTFVYRGLMNMGDIGMTTAVGFFQSVMGLILVVGANAIVNKINPENALF